MRGKQHQRPVGAGTASRGYRGSVFERLFLPMLFSRAQVPTSCRAIQTESRGSLMKTEYTIDQPTQVGRATQIAAMITTGIVACMWMYFGLLYLIHNPEDWRIVNQQLGYPLYIIPLIGVTHILGSVVLFIPKVPRLTEWVYAGFAFTLLLDFYSQLNSGGSMWDKFDPILVMAFVFASYGLRRCMGANRWSI
jgi:hypothetical protein